MAKTSGNRLVDVLILYRIIKLLVTPFDRQDAFKYGIIDKDGKVLMKYKDVKGDQQKRSYTYLHRFVFNLKRILKRVGLGGRFGSFATALALMLKENKECMPYKDLIESQVVTYLKETNQYEELLNENKTTVDIEDEPVMTCFGIDVYEKNGKLVSEFEYDNI